MIISELPSQVVPFSPCSIPIQLCPFALMALVLVEGFCRPQSQAYQAMLLTEAPPPLNAKLKILVYWSLLKTLENRIAYHLLAVRAYFEICFLQ